MSEALAASVVARLVEKSFDALTSCVLDEVVDTVLLLLDARFKVAPNDAALFEALVAVFAVLLVKLVADPLLDECVLFAAESAVEEVLPPLEALLLGLELP